LKEIPTGEPRVATKGDKVGGAGECPRPVAEINARLHEQKIIGGYDLTKDYPHLGNAMLVAVTEMNTREQIDALAKALGQVKSKK